MAKTFARLDHVEHDRKITWETDYEFLFCLQTGLLLALKERGRLHETQYRYALERLYAQRQERARKLLRKNGEGD